MTPVAAFAGTRCVSCHPDHQGRDTDLRVVSSDHCTSCHDRKEMHRRSPVMLAEKLNEQPEQCDKCHGNHEEHRLNSPPSLMEARKHLVAAHRRGSRWFHKDSCEKCHRDKRHASGRNAASKRGFFDPHVTHVERMNIRCTWCHRDVDIVDSSGVTLRRNTDVERCVQCHADDYYASVAGDVR